MSLDTSGYITTHPWLSFELDLRQCEPRFWMLLGEARSKCDHLKFVPLAEDTAARLMQVYFAKGVNATTAIEGNTLTEEQVRERMDGQLELPISKAYLGQEIDNMLRAYNGILRRVADREHVSISVETLKHLNSQILEGLAVEDHVRPGELRTTSVAAGPYLAPPADQVEGLLNQLCGWLDGEAFSTEDPAQRIPIGLIKAVVAHVYIEWIHPFGDGNGRLGRLVEFLILISSGVPAPAAHVLTSHYNDTRTQYYRELNHASRSQGDLRPFLLYAAQGLVDGLVGAIRMLHKQQELLMFQALVDEAFHGRHGEAPERQRLLAIAAARHDDWMLRSEARRLTPELAAAYASRTPKTLTRDIHKLIEMGFLEGSRDIIKADLTRVRGLRPFVLDPV